MSPSWRSSALESIMGEKGMSGELLSMAKWLAILFGCAAPIAPWLLFCRELSWFNTLSCYLMAYVGAALVIVLIFLGISRALGGNCSGAMFLVAPNIISAWVRAMIVRLYACGLALSTPGRLLHRSES